jgi:histidyl-tRNA synthetase
MIQKPSIPKGTRDFSPEEMAKRNYIFDTIRNVFSPYGYKQIETPAMENLSTLMGKYGEEGDKLLFKILNSGDFMRDVNPDDLDNRNLARLANQLSEKGLRYDLTVPFARYVVQHRNDITFPFKRFQIQPVWRADRPQKGRYREFFQCDVDVVGSDSLLNEVEIIQITDEVYRHFDVRVVIKLNNRKILTGIAETVNEADKIVDITVAIDKLDKIGLDKVNEELTAKGISAEAVKRLQPIILMKGNNREKLEVLRVVLAGSDTGMKGIEELEYILDKVELLSLKADLEVDLTLARGLSYYTGAIFEVKALDVEIGSITGGGRYDNLTGVFGMPGTSGVGISFGADRIFDVLNQLDLYPESAMQDTQVIFLNLDNVDEGLLLKHVNLMRAKHIRTELYPDKAKFNKQITYAKNNHIGIVVIINDDDVKLGQARIKNIFTDEQQTVKIEKIEHLLGGLIS